MSDATCSRTAAADGENTTSTIFTASDSDVTIRASDGMLFHLHCTNLRINTGAFPAAEFATNGEVVDLTEPSAVLTILFQFVYPRRHPSLSNMDLPALLEIAEAAEKYEVFAAMNICEIRLMELLPVHGSVELMIFGQWHGYPKIVDQSTLAICRLPLLEVAEKLPSQLLLPWLRYHAAWESVFRFPDCENLKFRWNVSESESCFVGGNNDDHVFCMNCYTSILAVLSRVEAKRSLRELRTTLINGSLFDIIFNYDYEYSGSRRCRAITYVPPFTHYMK